MIAQTIQLALAPVFVLVAVGNLMGVLAARLARVVDRSRTLQARHAQTTGAEHDMVVREARIVDLRIALIGRAILCLVLSGITIGLTVALLFVEELADADLQQVAAGTFIAAIGLLMWALLLLLRETRASSAALRIPAEILERGREL